MRNRGRGRRDIVLCALQASGLVAWSDSGPGLDPDDEGPRISQVVFQVVSGNHQDGQWE